MAKPKTPAVRLRRPAKNDDTLLIRSAESLGRVIGSLRRQIQESVKPDGSATRANKKRSRPSASKAAVTRSTRARGANATRSAKKR